MENSVDKKLFQMLAQAFHAFFARPIRVSDVGKLIGSFRHSSKLAHVDFTETRVSRRATYIGPEPMIEMSEIAPETMPAELRNAFGLPFEPDSRQPSKPT